MTIATHARFPTKGRLVKLSDALGDSTLLMVLGASFLIPLSMALYKVVHGVRSLFQHQVSVKKAIQKAEAGRPVEKSAPVFVRHDDVVQLTPQQIKLKEQAIELVKQGKPKEAAFIFRELTLDRMAIQTLEDAGLVKEACAILFDKKLPNRAGFLCMRKGYHFEAAECFLMAKMFADAGNAFSKAAERDYRLYRNAAQAYEAAALPNEAVACFEAILDFEKSVAMCMHNKDFKRVFSLALNPLFPVETFHQAVVESCSRVLHELPLSPKLAQDLGVVAAKSGQSFDISLAAKKMLDDKLLHRSFLAGAGRAVVEPWIASLKVGKEPWEMSAYLALAEALRDKAQYFPAGGVYEKLGRKADAVRCYLASGHTERIQAVLAGDSRAVQEIQQCIERFQKAGAGGVGADANQATARFWQEVNGVLARVSL